jgi:hypothetical protein
MRPDPARPSSPFGQLGGMASRIAWAIVLLGSLAGCGPAVGTGAIDFSALCLEEHPGDVRCCFPGEHIERTICCPPNSHEVSDVEHPEWTLCLPDETPADAGAALDGGADAEHDAGADAP